MQDAGPSNPFDHGYYNSDDLRKFGFKKVGDNVQIARNCTIVGLENVSLGNNIRIDDYVVISAGGGSFDVGDHVHIAAAAYFGCRGGITLSDFCGVAQGSRLYSGNDDYSGDALTGPTIPDRYRKVHIAPVTMGRHVVLGTGSIVLPGVTVGEGSSVGALSLVTKSLGDWGVFVGAPARKLKDRSRRMLEFDALLTAEERNA